MRLREAIALGLLLALAATGCSRLTFVKPKMERSDAGRRPPSWDIREDKQGDQTFAARNQLAMAQQRLEAGDLAEAEKLTRAALAISPKLADAYVVLAVIEGMRGNNAQSGAHSAKAVQLEPTNGVALNNHGAWLCANGRPAEALPLFDRALAMPNFSNRDGALANSGACALKLGQLDRAENALRQSIDLSPDNPTALAALAELHFRRGQYLEARAFSERRLAAASASVEVLQLAAQIEQKLGDTTASQRYLQRITTEFKPADAAQSRGDKR